MRVNADKSFSRRRLLPGHRKVVVVLTILLFVQQLTGGLWARGGHRHLSYETIPNRVEYESGSLIDGTYKGSADGYNPGITVEVVVENGSISSVEIVENDETPRWFRRVVNVIPERILSSQSTDIDTVTGATSSSYGIMSAVEDALKNAVK